MSSLKEYVYFKETCPKIEGMGGAVWSGFGFKYISKKYSDCPEGLFSGSFFLVLHIQQYQDCPFLDNLIRFSCRFFLGKKVFFCVLGLVELRINVPIIQFIHKKAYLKKINVCFICEYLIFYSFREERDISDKNVNNCH